MDDLAGIGACGEERVIAEHLAAEGGRGVVLQPDLEQVRDPSRLRHIGLAPGTIRMVGELKSRQRRRVWVVDIVTARHPRGDVSMQSPGGAGRQPL